MVAQSAGRHHLFQYRDRQLIALFSRPLEDLHSEDVRQLVVEQYPEGDTVEFKSTLPARGRTIDPWIQGESRIGTKAREEILEEVVAFANAHGGHLVLGIVESDDKPHRAVDVNPIPRCADLADRLRLQARDCIEPQIPVVGITGVPTDEDGAGVVVIRVDESRAAPHRLIPTLQCYVRRSDRSEKMTMREIQDLTLQRDRAANRADAAFSTRRQEFAAFMTAFIDKKKETDALGIRATLLPVGARLFIRKVYGNAEVQPVFEIYKVHLRKGSTSLLHLPLGGGAGRPILRGIKCDGDYGHYGINREVLCDGLIEYSLISLPTEHETADLYPEWAFGLTLNAILTAHRFRSAAGAPGAEYGLEVEFLRKGSDLRMTGFGGGSPVGRRWIIDPNPLLLPRLSLGDASEIPMLMSQIAEDLFNAAGIDLDGSDWTFEIPDNLLR